MCYTESNVVLLCREVVHLSTVWKAIRPELFLVAAQQIRMRSAPYVSVSVLSALEQAQLQPQVPHHQRS